jgi:L-fuculose-phosphate aldolase
MFTSQAFSKEKIKEKEISKINEFMSIGNWSLTEKVAITCRVLAESGHCTGLSGQISAKRDFNSYITQPLGQGFDEISVSSLLVVDNNLLVINGDGMANPANRFHSWLYQKRKDIKCIIHMHSKYASIIGMLGKHIEIAHMDVTCLYDEIAYVDNWPGIPVGNEEGKLISEAIGDKKALLLANHGYVVAATSVEAALHLSMKLELACELYYKAMLVGEIKAIEPELALEAKKWTSLESRIAANFNYYARNVLEKDMSCLD